MSRHLVSNDTPHSASTVSLHNLLEVSLDASEQSLVDAYVRLAARCHPASRSWHPGEADDDANQRMKRFHQLSGAFSILASKDERARYETHIAQNGDDRGYIPISAKPDSYTIFIDAVQHWIITHLAQGKSESEIADELCNMSYPRPLIDKCLAAINPPKQARQKRAPQHWKIYAGVAMLISLFAALAWLAAKGYRL